MVVMVVTQTLELIIFQDICAQTWPVTQNCPKQTEKWLFFAEILQILALKSLWNQKLCGSVKNSSFMRKKLKFFGKNSSILTSKLNDTVVAHYTNYQKNVKKTSLL